LLYCNWPKFFFWYPCHVLAVEFLDYIIIPWLPLLAWYFLSTGSELDLQLGSKNSTANTWQGYQKKNFGQLQYNKTLSSQCNFLESSNYYVYFRHQCTKFVLTDSFIYGFNLWYFNLIQQWHFRIEFWLWISGMVLTSAVQ
jgi:hypothetical protein